MPKLMLSKNRNDMYLTQEKCPCEPLLSVGSIRAYYTIRGYVSDADTTYEGFNVCNYTGDSREHVDKCRALLCERFGIPTECLVIPRQTHSVNIRIIDSLEIEPAYLDDVDALVTTLDNVIIGVSTADCVPVVFADADAGVIGVAHAGWRGAVGGIVRGAVETMIAVGADVKRIKAAIGPSICVDCFEVGEEVAARFPDECVVRREDWRRPHVNLQQYVVGELMQSGLGEMNITPFSNELCTKCHPSKFFSARRLGVNSGRMFTFVKK